MVALGMRITSVGAWTAGRTSRMSSCIHHSRWATMAVGVEDDRSSVAIKRRLKGVSRIGSKKSRKPPEPHFSMARRTPAMARCRSSSVHPWMTSDAVETLRYGFEKRQRTDPLGCPRRYQGERTASGEPAGQCSTPHSHRVHDRENVIGLLLEGRRVGNMVGQADATTLEVDRPRVSRYSLDVVIDVRVGHLQV